MIVKVIKKIKLKNCIKSANRVILDSLKIFCFHMSCIIRYRLVTAY